MNSYTIKLLVFFLSLFILITVSSQVYLAFQDTTKTETAIEYSAAEEVDFKGIFVRNEKVISYTGAGVISYPNPDGSKIAKGSVVANVYNNESEILINQQIDELTEELNLLNKAQNKGTTEVAQPEFLTQLIEEKYQEIASSIDNNNLEDISAERSEFLTLMNIMQIVIGEETNYNDRINYLTEQISTLNAQKTSPLQSIIVEEPGYFVSYTDGYEDKLSIDTIDSITADNIKNIILEENQFLQASSYIGKIIDGYKWKMIGIIDNSRNYFTEGESVELNLSSSATTVNAVIDEIKDTDNSQESIVILSCDKLTYSLVQHRVEHVEMVLNNFNGIKVPRKAIRFNNGEKGVYIKLGEQIIFRKINVIYEADDYVLSKNEIKDGYLSLYDDIVVEGIKAEHLNERSTTNDENATEGTTVSEITEKNIVIGETAGTTTATASPSETTADEEGGNSGE